MKTARLLITLLLLSPMPSLSSEPLCHIFVTESSVNMIVDPSSDFFVDSGSTTSLTVTPFYGYTISPNVIGDCPAGSFTGSVYTTGPVTADCWIQFEADVAPAGVNPLPPGMAANVITKYPIGEPYKNNGYLEYLPATYTPSGAASPLLIFFHGLGQNGSGDSSDLDIILQGPGPNQVIQAGAWPLSRPFIVLSPQHAGNDCMSANEMHAFIAYALATYNVDTSRIYLTGLSCGAEAIDDYFVTYADADKIAAVVSVAGNALPTWSAQGCRFVNDVAFWAFHGDDDETVDIAGDNSALPQFEACPQPRKDVEYTVYDGMGHDSWTQTYDLSGGHDIYSWFLTFSR